jgi:hypothetical protein
LMYRPSFLAGIMMLKEGIGLPVFNKYEISLRFIRGVERNSLR